MAIGEHAGAKTLFTCLGIVDVQDTAYVCKVDIAIMDQRTGHVGSPLWQRPEFHIFVVGHVAREIWFERDDAVLFRSRDD